MRVNLIIKMFIIIITKHKTFKMGQKSDPVFELNFTIAITISYYNNYCIRLLYKAMKHQSQMISE